jgi:hypothetical protein
MVKAGGVIARVTSSAGVTVMVAVWTVSLRGPAVRVTLPSARAMTAIAAEAAPAGMVTLAGTSTLLGSLLTRGTTVACGCVGAMVTVKVPALPAGRLRVGGVRAVRVGGSCSTMTVLSADVPPSGPTVRVVVPGTRPVTVRRAVRRPAGTVRVAGALARPVGARATGITVSSSWAAFRVRVKLAVAPT